jgi:hypothetical protein
MTISENLRRNHRMSVYHNIDADGKKVSITRHEPIDPSKPCITRRFLGKAAAKGQLK